MQNKEEIQPIQPTKPNNWKSNLAYFTFLLAYIYAVIDIKKDTIIEITGYLLLTGMLFMMLRNRDLADVIKNISNALAERFKK